MQSIQLAPVLAFDQNTEVKDQQSLALDHDNHGSRWFKPQFFVQMHRNATPRHIMWHYVIPQYLKSMSLIIIDHHWSLECFGAVRHDDRTVLSHAGEAAAANRINLEKGKCYIISYCITLYLINCYINYSFLNKQTCFSMFFLCFCDFRISIIVSWIMSLSVLRARRDCYDGQTRGRRRFTSTDSAALLVLIIFEPISRTTYRSYRHTETVLKQYSGDYLIWFDPMFLPSVHDLTTVALCDFCSTAARTEPGWL